jgi:hypothetical protein
METEFYSASMSTLKRERFNPLPAKIKSGENVLDNQPGNHYLCSGLCSRKGKAYGSSAKSRIPLHRSHRLASLCAAATMLFRSFHDIVQIPKTQGNTLGDKL